jgi:hypothetical protein
MEKLPIGNQFALAGLNSGEERVGLLGDFIV